MFKWLVNWWRRRQRRVDLDILWPICKQKAEGDIAEARAVFMAHMCFDSAYEGMSQEETDEFIRTKLV